MVTVAQLIDDVAEVMREPRETVNAYARALLDSGDLPKSRGRAIAAVETKHIVKMFLAVIISPRIKDTAEAVSSYFSMRKPGVTDDHPEKLQSSAGTYLCQFIDVIHSPLDGKKNPLRNLYRDSEIEIVLNWPQIEIRIPGKAVERFKEGGHPGLWEGYHKRSVIISGRAFLLLGFGKGRDYFATTNSVPEAEPSPYSPKSNFFKSWEMQGGRWVYVGLSAEETDELLKMQGFSLCGDDLVVVGPGEKGERYLDLFDRHENERLNRLGIME